MTRKAPFLLFFISLFFTLVTKGDTVDITEYIIDNQCDEIIYHPSVYPISSLLNIILRPLELLDSLKDLDLRETDFFKTALKWRYWPYFPFFHIPYNVKNLLEFGGYLNYMSHDQDYDYYNNSDDEDKYIFNTERKGSVEEYVVFMADRLLNLIDSREENYSCPSSNPRYAKPTNKYLEELNGRITNVEGTNDTTPYISQEDYKQFTDFLNFPFQSFQVQQFLVYDSRPEWSEWTADKLAAALNKFAFFGEYKTYSSDKAEEYVRSGLPGGDNPLLFILQNLKVLQSPKIEPVLRMAMARYVAENKNFDNDVFKFLSCFLYIYGYYTAPLLGLEGTDVELFLTQLNQTYQESFTVKESGMIRNPEVWIDFIDHVLVELERIDIDNVFYDAYAIVLKFRLFLVRLDYDGQMALNIDRLMAFFEKSQFQLSCGMSPGMVEAAKTILSNLKSDQFWNLFNQSFKMFANEYFQSILLPSSIIDSIKTTTDTIANELGVRKNMTDFFETKLSDTEDPLEISRRHFEVTNYLKTHQKTNFYSLLQPNLGEIDLSYLLRMLLRNLQSGQINVVTHFEPVVRKLYEDIELNLLDYGMIKNSVDIFAKLTNYIIDRVLSTD